MHANSPDLARELGDMALATAITYPLGVVGVMLVLEPVSYTHLDVYKRQDNMI